MFVYLPAHFLRPVLINFLMDSYARLLTDPSHQQHCLGTPISCSVGCVTAGGGGRQRPKAHPPSRLSKAVWGCGGIFRWAGKCPHAPARSHLSSTQGRAGCESELRGAGQLRPGRGTLPGDSPARSRDTRKSRALAGAEDAAGCSDLLFKWRVYFGSSVFNFPSFMTH